MSHKINGCYMNGNTFVQPDQDEGNYKPIPSGPPPRNDYGPYGGPVPFYQGPGPDYCCMNRPNRHGPIIKYPPIINDGPCECIDHIHEQHYLKPTIVDDCDCEDWIKPKPPVRGNVPTVINIETKLLISVQLTLYGVREEDDITVILTEGQQYCMYYVTEEGVFKATGYLKVIDTSIPTREYQYIGNTEPTAQNAYIILDCSTIGNADIKKIYINTIRSITEVTGDEKINGCECCLDYKFIEEDNNSSDNTTGGEDSSTDDKKDDNQETNNKPSGGNNCDCDDKKKPPTMFKPKRHHHTHCCGDDHKHCNDCEDDVCCLHYKEI